VRPALLQGSLLSPRLRETGHCPSRPGVASVLCVVLLALHGNAQQSKPNEYQLKAIYLYNFGKFVTWPAEAPVGKGDSFAVCVLGRDPFGAILDSTFAGETLNNKPVLLRRIPRPQDARDCRILFISSTEDKHLKEILLALANGGVLTVSDMPDFVRRGGMIQFTLEGEKIRFEINLTSAESARLVLSSELLKIATDVTKTVPSGD
jgi:YfiR/HmsC-like